MEVYQELTTKQGIMRGFLHKPDNNGKYPLVILCHGFTGNKIDSKFLIVEFARRLCKANIACLRFDFIGSGESEGNFKDMTLLKEVEQAELVLDYAKNFNFIESISIMGFSMGGAVASLVSKRRTKDINKLILWSPAGNMRKIAKKHFDNNIILNNGNCDIGGLELGKGFLKELMDLDLYKGIEEFTKPVMICHGSSDLSVPIEFGMKYSIKYQNCVFNEISGADHVYSSLKWREEIYLKSIDFLRENY